MKKMRKVVTKKVVNVFAIAMLIAGMYSCSSDDDNNDYKEVKLTNEWLNGKWHIHDILNKEGKSVINSRDECIRDNEIIFNSKDLKYEFNAGKLACEDDGNKPGEVLETGTYQISNNNHTIKMTTSEGSSYEWIEVKVSQKGRKSQLEFKESNEDDEDSEDSRAGETYILRKE